MITYRYYRDANGRPLVTLCTVHTRLHKYTGIAICSPKDNPNKAVGRRIALERAYHALMTRKTRLPIFREEALRVLKSVGVRSSFLKLHKLHKSRMTER